MVDSKKLTALIGKQARVWSYTCSHDRLVIEVGGGSSKGGGYLIFAFCSALNFPIFWKINQPLLLEQSELIEFSDGDVSILCQEVIWQEDYVK